MFKVKLGIKLSKCSLKNVNASIDHSCRLIKQSLNNDEKAGLFPIQIDYHQDSINDGHTIPLRYISKSL